MKFLSSVLMFYTLTSPINSYLVLNSNEVSTLEDCEDDKSICLNVSSNTSCFETEYQLHTVDAEDLVSSMTNRILFYLNATIKDNDETQLVDFINDNKNSEIFLKSISKIFSDQTKFNEQLYFINILLASDIEIFDYWYKLALSIATNSPSFSLARSAKDILNYYSEDFVYIDISNVLA